MKKILVIGSKGFIGSNLVAYYEKINTIDVWGCDVISDYSSRNYFLIDASNSDFNEVFQQVAFDVCINCSGSASVPLSMINPGRDFHLNVLNVFNMLDSIRKNIPSCKFVNLSSAAVYGNPESLPIKEDTPINPLSPYGWHKLQSEILCKQFNQNFALHTCSLRIFSAYGIGLRKQLFWDWFQKINDAASMSIYGTGKESRDFIYIDDLIQCIECVVARGDFNAGIYNIANGQEIYIADAIKEFKKASGKSFEYTFTQETRPGDPINWVADISKLKTLGYQQQVTFEKGVEILMKWLQQEKK
ncbi:NAD-dependent epimerase/dehydratase family protein [Cytophaga hutchinsonii]|uniref:dTDP-glucose 4,6 dehydratase n=1 Tax=Cytophaga hutchinsonii (strain ATCC 33406 / DSM 1761 / CIP 103989 / NBRC 15051 / NCIMB 9469 / D465) TaxID=269798 RepID=A0A6N4SPA0_CYTH3|nr:NAD-dependent epimerase/dehydratase family protein [Cytophaga hutchinsonii]ABG58133.1 dTDP-glucose 4,6 dehydratase [Cytophaga hutchinsonii ATCC 33406]SFX14306.1 dTDP-glucose 4,6-dehydratase [Cytophaga hutchinsonii ATCC 33406]